MADRWKVPGLVAEVPEQIVEEDMVPVHSHIQKIEAVPVQKLMGHFHIQMQVQHACTHEVPIDNQNQ